MGDPLTDSIPPIPPAPQVPEPAPQFQQPQYAPQPGAYGQQAPFQPPAQAPQPQYAPYGYQAQQQPYGQPPQHQGGYPPQGYAAPGQFAYPQQPGYYPPQGQWAPKEKSSGYRVSAGVVQLLLGLWLFMPMVFGFSTGLPFMGMLFFVAFVGNITAGIILLVKHRGTTPGAPITALASAGFAGLLSLISIGLYDSMTPIVALPMAAAIGVVMGIGLAKERRGI